MSPNYGAPTLPLKLTFALAFVTRSLWNLYAIPNFTACDCGLRRGTPIQFCDSYSARKLKEWAQPIIYSAANPEQVESKGRKYCSYSYTIRARALANACSSLLEPQLMPNRQCTHTCQLNVASETFGQGSVEGEEYPL